MYAIIEIAGCQYKAASGGSLKVPKLRREVGESITLDSVLMARRDEETLIGTPYIAGMQVSATVEGHGRGSKITVYTYKRRKGYHRKIGHRQDYSLLRIDAIQFPL